MGGRDHSVKCETCGVQRGGLNDLRCSCDVSTFMANLPDRVVDIEEWSPSKTDDPVEVANRWNGNSGTREPDFSMNAEDTASFLASAVIKLAPLVAAAKAWHRHTQNHSSAVTICRRCEAKDVGFCNEHNMSYEVLLTLEGELENAIDALGEEGKP